MPKYNLSTKVVRKFIKVISFIQICIQLFNLCPLIHNVYILINKTTLKLNEKNIVVKKL